MTPQWIITHSGEAINLAQFSAVLIKDGSVQAIGGPGVWTVYQGTPAGCQEVYQSLLQRLGAADSRKWTS